MGCGGVLLMWGTVADVAVQDEEGGAALRLAKHLQGMLDPINIVSVADPQNVPSVTQEPGRDVLGEGDSRVSFDGDVVVVVDPAEVVQAKVARQRRRLRSDALPEWTAGGLDARDPVILWMPRRLAVELPEAAYVVERHRGLAESLVVGVYRLGPGQVEYGPEQHRGVTVREHESV